MKTFNKTLIAAATLTAFGLAAAPAAVALDASASVATSYLWRGAEQGTGDAALAVDLSDSAMGVTYGVWISSGAGTTEHDYYASYAGSVGEIGYELGLVDYNYQDAGASDMEETYVSLSYGPLSVSQFENSGNADDYTVVSYEAGAYSVAYGEITTAGVNTSHTDVSYSVNDSLSLTLSDSDAAEDVIFVATYSLPF
jgi:uncharacterized protein (TIGR02001 family)